MKVLIIFLVGIFGGAFGTLTGGCSLFTIPVLIFLGLPSPIAIATNRLGLTGMSLVGLGEFHRQKQVHYRLGFLVGIPAMLGSIIGANLVLTIEESLLRRLIAIFSIVIVAGLLLNPKAGMAPKPGTGKAHQFIAVILGFVLGIYGGFYGVAFATSLNALLIILFGLTFIEAAATHKVAMVLLSVMSTAIFMAHQAIDYRIGMAQFGGMAIGSYVGSRYAEHIGNEWIRRLVLLVGVAMAVKLLV